MKQFLTALAYGFNSLLVLGILVLTAWGIGAGATLLSPVLGAHYSLVVWILVVAVGLFTATLRHLDVDIDFKNTARFQGWPELLFFGLCAELLAVVSCSLLMAHSPTSWVQLVIPMLCALGNALAAIFLLCMGGVFCVRGIVGAIADAVIAACRYVAYLRRLVREDQGRTSPGVR